MPELPEVGHVDAVDSVDVLMATYNGAEYINLQIASVLAQSHRDFRLLVRDDGSSDGTVQLIQEWARRDVRVSIVSDCLGRLGSAGNFLALLKESTASAVLFADQDDIWMSTKVASSLAALHRAEMRSPRHPLLIVSDAASFEEGVGYLSASTQRAHPECLEDFLFLNGGLYGCCMTLNRELARLVVNRPVDFCAQHDHLVSLVAISLGRVVYVPECLMFYRRHARNLSGGPVSLSSKVRNYLLLRTPLFSTLHLKGVESFVKSFASDLPPAQRDVLARFIKLPHLSRFGIARQIVTHGFRLYGSRTLILLKLLLRPIT